MLNHNGTTVGPIISKVQFDRIWQYNDEAKKEGYKFLYGGERTAEKKQTFTGSSSGESKTNSGESKTNSGA
jgi:acyl-CoA reductase-like NAD-dependent aldehyde dehydrogenase